MYEIGVPFQESEAPLLEVSISFFVITPIEEKYH